MNISTIFATLLFGLSLTACVHSGDLKPGTAWVAHAPEWAEEAEDVFADAATHVDLAAQSRVEGSWGVILDLDETVLNNVAYQVSLDRSGATYTPESWFAWTQNEEATLVPGAADFIRHVNLLGGHVAFVTNRRDTEQLATENNLADLGLRRHHDFRVFLTRAVPDSPSDKDERFALVSNMLAAQGYPDVEIVAYVGDGKGDKPSAPGNWEFFCIDQGAMYGDPCAKVPGTGK